MRQNEIGTVVVVPVPPPVQGAIYLQRAKETPHPPRIDLGPLKLFTRELGLVARELSPRPPTIADVDVEERRVVIEALRYTDGHVAAAAQHLGMSRATLYRLLSKHGIPTRRG